MINPFFIASGHVDELKGVASLQNYLTYIFLILIFSLASSSSGIFADDEQNNKTIFLAILARNKEHVLTKYLKCIDNLDYNKKLITVYVNTNNNIDHTKEILEEWMKNNENKYARIIYENKDINENPQTNPHDWPLQRFKILAGIRNRSLQKAQESKADYYFVVDCDNFIAPYTLKDLVMKDKPIIAPLLRSIPEPGDEYANYFYEATSNGYFKDHPEYYKILKGSKIGTFKVGVVHCTYLIKAEHLDKLNYLDDTNDFEFIVFSRNATKNHIDQYICNEKEYGVQLHFHQNVSIEEEKRRIKNILTMP